MAKNVYFGTADLARKIKKIYLGVDNVARQVKKGYIGVDGVAHLFYTSSVESLPYRHDSDTSFNTVVGPMDINTFVRYGTDVQMADTFYNVMAVAATKDFMFAGRRGSDNGYVISGRDVTTGATLNTIDSSGNVWRYLSGCSKYVVFVNSQYSNDSYLSVYDRVTVAKVRVFDTRWGNYVDPMGGHDETVIAKEWSSEYLCEYNADTGAFIRYLDDGNERFDGDYLTRLRRLDGANGKMLMWKDGSARRKWGVLDHDTMARLTILSSYPLYNGLPNGAYVYMKP